MVHLQNTRVFEGTDARRAAEAVSKGHLAHDLAGPEEARMTPVPLLWVT